MATFSHKGIRYHFAEWGERSAPPFILLHGFSQSSATWQEIAPDLAKDRLVIAPDFIGHGKSDRPTDPACYEMVAVTDMIGALLGHLELERADLLGYSMGGRIALAFARAQPHRLASLILESAGLGPKSEEERQAARERDSRAIALLMEGDIEKFMDYWQEQVVFASQKHLPEQARANLRRARLANDPHALALSLRGTGQHAMPDLSHEVGKLQMKILYIAGNLDSRYLKIAEELTCQPNISCVLLPAGHNTHLEAPEAFVRHVKDFLQESSPLHRL